MSNLSLIAVKQIMSPIAEQVMVKISHSKDPILDLNLRQHNEPVSFIYGAKVHLTDEQLNTISDLDIGKQISNGEKFQINFDKDGIFDSTSFKLTEEQLRIIIGVEVSSIDFSADDDRKILINYSRFNRALRRERSFYLTDDQSNLVDDFNKISNGSLYSSKCRIVLNNDELIYTNRVPGPYYNIKIKLDGQSRPYAYLTYLKF